MEQNWKQLWLKYDQKNDNGNGRFFHKVSLSGFSAESRVVKSALEELGRGAQGMLGITPSQVNDDATLTLTKSEALTAESYQLSEKDGKLTISAGDEKGLLYGVFHALRVVSMEKSLAGINVTCKPDNPLRMYNHWDNMDGSIERGYSGRSFFFVNNDIVIDERTKDYARLVASVGINGVVINNVNVKQAATWLITDRFFEKVAQLSNIFADYGIKFYLSLNYAATIELGGIDSADPLDERVIAWWKAKMKECFEKIPNLGGFLVKADSEGRPGPFTYGRTQADGANMLAEAVKPYGGIIIWRCFVYNCRQDWRDYKTDRARAGYDNFIQMDGDYAENVILQIKNGPMDFQIREPISPLLGGLKKTNQMLEVQVPAPRRR
ncbi:MAG: alpha-glucuronidase, partial [Lachnospiraceae bacterium]|nr:alpha-glucuronidase [Lachnospiraceae bacterium]